MADYQLPHPHHWRQTLKYLWNIIAQNQLCWLHPRVDNNKINKAQASRFCGTHPITPAYGGEVRWWWWCWNLYNPYCPRERPSFSINPHRCLTVFFQDKQQQTLPSWTSLQIQKQSEFLDKSSKISIFSRIFRTKVKAYSQRLIKEKRNSQISK